MRLHEPHPLRQALQILLVVPLASSLHGQWNGITRIDKIQGDAVGRTRAGMAESSAENVLRRISGLPLRAPSTEWEAAHLLAALKSVQMTLSVQPGDALGIVTIADPAGDVFAARWKPKPW